MHSDNNKVKKKKKQNNEPIYWLKKWLHVSLIETHKTNMEIKFLTNLK